MIFLPWIAVFLLLKNRRRYLWLSFSGIFAMQLFAMLPISYMVVVAAATKTKTPPIQGNINLASFSGNADYPLRISWYDPSLGGTNCDSDCTTMASGDKVASWIGGRGGVYAAACPRSGGWYHGLRFSVGDNIFECRDTGGWINCYQPGQLDKAIHNAHSKGYLLDQPAIAKQSYCWVDLMVNTSIPYGTLTNNWSLK